VLTFDQLWSTDYAPRLAAARAAESARRSEAFLDTTLTVCGEEIRQMTPADLLMLDGFESPFVSGRPADATPADVAFFLWQLHADNRPGLLNAFRRGRLIGRLRHLDLDDCRAQIVAYCARMFADLGGAEETPAAAASAAIEEPPPVYFLATLMYSVATDIGHLDPHSGLLLSHTPLPRLIQYRTAATEGHGRKTYTDFHSLRVECQERVNLHNWHLRQAAAA
jgi:hypothetical protein